MKLPRAVLFDLDDTLYEQATWLTGAWEAVVVAAALAAGMRAIRVRTGEFANRPDDPQTVGHCASRRQRDRGTPATSRCRAALITAAREPSTSVGGQGRTTS